MKVRPRLLYALAFVAFSSIGCGGGGGGGGHPPAISNLIYSPTSAMVNEGGGTVTIEGSFNFTDSGGDLARVVLTTYDNNHVQIGSVTIPAPLPGVTAGRLFGALTVDTSNPGVFTFQVVVYDSTGSASNTLDGTFTVTPDPWQPRSNPLPPDTGITSVTYGGGIFLAGAGDNSILGSSDGASWFIANPGIGMTVNRITYGNGHFLAIAWDTGTLRDRILASADNGATWTEASTRPFAFRSLRDISFGNGIFFATEEDSDLLYASQDNGATWNLVSYGLAGGGMDAPAYGNGKFVAAVNEGKIMVSNDGINWSLGNPYGGYYRPYITFDNGVFVIVQLVGDVYVSHDGAATWQSRFTVPGMMSDVAAGGGVYVGVGRDDTLAGMFGVLCTSSGGDSWMSRRLGTSALRGIAYGNGTFVAVGDNATIYQSAVGWRP